MSGLDATKITFGVLLNIIGISFGIFGFFIFILFLGFPSFGLLIILFPGVIPILVGYTLLKRFMGGWDMVRATIATLVVGFFTYLIGVIMFISTFGGM